MYDAAPDPSGEWLFHGHPWDAPFEGQIALTLQQPGTQISGELGQLIVPFTGQPQEDPSMSEADVVGEVGIDLAGKHDLFIRKPISRNRDFRAVFAGTYDRSAGTITGTFKNTSPRGGMFVIERT